MDDGERMDFMTDKNTEIKVIDPQELNIRIRLGSGVTIFFEFTREEWDSLSIVNKLKYRLLIFMLPNARLEKIV